MNVVFLKNLTNETEVTMQNIRSVVQVTNIVDSSPIVSLHNMVQKIFFPLIQEEAPEKTNFLDMVFQLRTALVMEARKRGSKLSKFDYDINKFRGILEPIDELEIWKSLTEETDLTDHNKQLFNTASILNRHFEKLHIIFPKLANMHLGDITGVIPTIKNTLDRIWNDGSIDPPNGYPQERMVNFFRIISKAFGSRIEQEFTDRDADGNLRSNVWEKQFSDQRVKLIESQAICQQWATAFTQLTKRDWQQSADNFNQRSKMRVWAGEPYTDSYLKKFIIRLNEIINIRAQHDELLRLLSKEDQEKFKVEDLFNGFRDGKSFYISEQLTDSWVSTK